MNDGWALIEHSHLEHSHLTIGLVLAVALVIILMISVPTNEG